VSASCLSFIDYYCVYYVQLFVYVCMFVRLAVLPEMVNKDEYKTAGDDPNSPELNALSARFRKSCSAS